MDLEKPAIDIKGKTILVTGAYGLIGMTISKGFLAAGANVILADIREDLIETIKGELIAEHFQENSFLLTTLDITDVESCKSAIKLVVEKFGKLDVLINNAAIDAKFDIQNAGSVNPSRFEDYPIELLRKSVDVNLTGTVIITQQACRQMLEQGYGNIINVASTYSVVAPNQSLYDFGGETQQYKPVDYIASKSFIPNFTRYIATFYAREGIRCNAIVPHAVFNNHDQPFLENFAKLSPMGRMCNKEELIGPFLFLASDASSYMTGSVVNVDGGWTAW